MSRACVYYYLCSLTPLHSFAAGAGKQQATRVNVLSHGLNLFMVNVISGSSRRSGTQRRQMRMSIATIPYVVVSLFFKPVVALNGGLKPPTTFYFTLPAPDTWGGERSGCGRKKESCRQLKNCQVTVPLGSIPKYDDISHFFPNIIKDKVGPWYYTYPKNFTTAANVRHVTLPVMKDDKNQDIVVFEFSHSRADGNGIWHKYHHSADGETGDYDISCAKTGESVSCCGSRPDNDPFA